MRRTVTGAAAAVATLGLTALLGACAPADEPTSEIPASRPLEAQQTTTGTDGVGGLGFDVVALDPDGDGLVVHRLGDR